MIPEHTPDSRLDAIVAAIEDAPVRPFLAVAYGPHTPEKAAFLRDLRDRLKDELIDTLSFNGSTNAEVFMRIREGLYPTASAILIDCGHDPESPTDPAAYARDILRREPDLRIGSYDL